MAPSPPISRRRFGALAAGAVLAAPRLRAAGAEVLVAVAANFAHTLAALAPGFAAETGHVLTPVSGATGKLYAQIRAGAPFHVFLSADAATPARLVAEGRAVEGAGFTYALGRLALWSADPGRIGADGPAALADPALRHVALANPALAPYGVAARETLQALGLWDALQSRLAMGQNVGQAHALAASGAAELGFVAVSDLIRPGAAPGGSVWRVPATLHAPIRQDAALLAGGDAAAAAFLAYLRGPAARAVIAAHGYGPPGDPGAA